MTVQDTGIVQVTGTGSVATYTFGFRILQAADLVVVVTDLLGDDTTLIQVPSAPTSAQYTLNTVPDIYGGGSITLGMGNLPAGYLLTMKRNPAITQTESYQQLGPFPATQFEQGLDELTMQVQALSQVASVQFPLGDPVGLNNVLPSAYDRAGWRK